MADVQPRTDDKVSVNNNEEVVEIFQSFLGTQQKKKRKKK